MDKETRNVVSQFNVEETLADVSRQIDDIMEQLQIKNIKDFNSDFINLTKKINEKMNEE